VKEVTTHEAKTRLSSLITHVLEGGEVVICRGRQPVARLVPVGPLKAAALRPPVGTVTSEPVAWTPDAFAPLGEEELREWGL
jgi:antitoxin (DNA-binding transcriptional repressor) of toxin-antitoxin stability system